jgi:pyrroloquinoline quinone (PQQ) biosynthesis protein C
MATLTSTDQFREAVYRMIGEHWWEHKSPLMQFLQHELTIEGARVFIREHCVFADRFPRWFGNIIGNCPHLDARRYMIRNLYQEEVRDETIERGHYDSLVDFAVSLGLDREEVMNHAGAPHTVMAVAYWDYVSRSKPWLEAFTAVGVLELITNAQIARRHGGIPINSPRIWAPLKARLPGADMAHWDAAEQADGVEGGHGDEALDIVAKYADTPEKRQACLDALAESISVLCFQFDTVGRQALAADKVAATP